MGILDKVIKRIGKKYIYLMFIVMIAAGVGFFKCSSQNLHFTGPWTLDLIEYEEKARYDNWDSVIKKTDDPFVIKKYSNKEELVLSKNLYNYSNFPAYLFYKLLHLRGAGLWLSQRFITFFLYILVIVLVYLIAVRFYTPFIALTAGILTAFSPHIWIPFHIGGNPNRAYNILTSMLVIYLFLLFLKRKKWHFILLTGIFMGVNFLFFHIGSFIIPLIIFIYCIYLSFIKKNLFYIIKFISIALIAVCSALILMHLHSTYFKLQHNVIYTWIKQYRAFGPATSHSVDNIVFFNSQKLLLNIKNFIASVFINGKSRDWHFILSPPGIPMVYNYLVSVFFLAGCLISIRERKREDMFFFLWFSTFCIIYSMVIEVRPKNIMWMLPAVFILAASSVPAVGAFLHKKIKIGSRETLIRFIFILLMTSSIGAGSFIIFYHLPKRNFYDGMAYMGTYQVYKYLSKKGYSDRTKIIFTMPEAEGGHMMLRLFTGKGNQIVSLSQHGVPFPPKEVDWKKAETSLLKNSDKIFYCFSYWTNRHGHIYFTDEHYRNVFKKIHPEAVPFIIKGLDDGKAVWRIYEIGTEESAKKEDSFKQDKAKVNTPDVQVLEKVSIQNKKISEELQVKEEVALEDKIIGPTFRILAKTFVALVDINKLKKKNIKKIDKMSEEKFQKQYAKAYKDIKDIPEHLRVRYGIDENMTREQSIKIIRILDKKKLYELLNSIPDVVIAGKFKEDLSKRKQKLEGKNSDIISQIGQAWNNIVKKMSDED